MRSTDAPPASSSRPERKLDGAAIVAALADAGLDTPAYVYDLDAIANEARAVVQALGTGHAASTPATDGLCAYAIKANGAAPIVRTLIEAGCGADIVSGGELLIALAAGARPDRIVYNGVAKRDDEIDAAIRHAIKAIHAESVEEIDRIAARARALGAHDVAVGIRINPGVQAETHSHIATGHDEAKFGVHVDDVAAAFDRIGAAAGRLKLVGLSVHVGSQLMDPGPYLAGVDVLAEVAKGARQRGFTLHYLDSGGGFGIGYKDGGAAAAPRAFVRATIKRLADAGIDDLPLVIEPGRALVAAHGVLISRVLQPKRSRAGGVDRRWLFIDAGMNDLIRPALYQAHHRVEPIDVDGTRDFRTEARVDWRVAGPVCESSDDFGVHALPEAPPTHVLIRDAGAYGRSMASEYNARPIASEVFLRDGVIVDVIRSKVRATS